jgi:predicted nucleic acid-binding protein
MLLRSSLLISVVGIASSQQGLPILTEILRGCLVEKEKQKIQNLFQNLTQLEFFPSLWEEASHIGSRLRKKGITVKTLDLLIATYALSYNKCLLTKDRDFSLMKKAGLNLLLIE